MKKKKAKSHLHFFFLSWLYLYKCCQAVGLVDSHHLQVRAGVAFPRRSGGEATDARVAGLV